MCVCVRGACDVFRVVIVLDDGVLVVIVLMMKMMMLRMTIRDLGLIIVAVSWVSDDFDFVCVLWLYRLSCVAYNHICIYVYVCAYVCVYMCICKCMC